MSSTSPPALPARLVRLFFIGHGSLAIGCSIARHAWEADWLSFRAAVALSIAAVAPMVAFAFTFHRAVRADLDELLQRVLLEGFAFAFIAMVPIVGLWIALTNLGVRLPHLDPVDITIFPGSFVAVGVLLALRRYS